MKFKPLIPTAINMTGGKAAWEEKHSVIYSLGLIF